jgi:hypothetical protein
LQNDLEAEYPGLDIQLLGVNAFGHESGVGLATESRDIPMLQDVDDDGNSLGDTWELWDVEWRDVVILDADNVPVAVYNLLDNDLADPDDYDALKNLLVSTADVATNESSISGYVYFDTNDDGIRDAAELAISQVEISLSGTDNQGQPVNMTTHSGTDGSYSFTALPEGDYVVTQKQPSMTVDGRDTIGSLGGTVGDDRFEISLGDGVDAEGYNFGERGRSAKTVSLTDFFSSTTRNSMLFVSEPDGHLEWYCLQGEWSEYEQADVASDSSMVSIVLEDNQNSLWQGTFDRDDAYHVRHLARTSDKEMDRVSGDLELKSDGEAEQQPESEAEGEALRDMALTSLRISSEDIHDAPLDADEVDTVFSENEFLP